MQEAQNGNDPTTAHRDNEDGDQELTSAAADPGKNPAARRTAPLRDSSQEEHDAVGSLQQVLLPPSYHHSMIPWHQQPSRCKLAAGLQLYSRVHHGTCQARHLLHPGVQQVPLHHCLASLNADTAFMGIAHPAVQVW